MPFLCFLQVVVLSGLVAAGGWDLQAAEGSLDACLLEAFRNIVFWVKYTHTRLQKLSSVTLHFGG